MKAVRLDNGNLNNIPSWLPTACQAYKYRTHEQYYRDDAHEFRESVYYGLLCCFIIT